MYSRGTSKCKSGAILNMCSIVVNIDVPLIMFLLGTKMCPKILPTMLFCLSIAFVSALSPGAYGFLGFNCFLANLLKTPGFFCLKNKNISCKKETMCFLIG